MAEAHNPWLRLSSGELSVEIDPLGAQLSTVRDSGGNDLLWNGDPAFWTGRAPLLFPIVGNLAGGQYRVGTRTYCLPRHGFARNRRFRVIEASSSAAVLGLTFDADTLQVYPFPFELEVRFSLDGPRLSVTTRVSNVGKDAMLASVGYHPGFRWPLPYGRARSAHFLEFETDEPAPIRRLDSAGLLTPVEHPTPIEARRLPLTDALFQEDVIIFDQLKSRSVTYGALDAPRLRIDFPDAAYLGVWSKSNAGFVCIEPWHGIADPAGFAAGFAGKPGIVEIAAAASLSTTMSITLSDAR